MKRFVEGMDRGQSTLFPECLEDWICQPLSAGWRRDNAMNRGPQIAICGKLQKFAYVDDKTVLDWRRLDPSSVLRLDL